MPTFWQKPIFWVVLLVILIVILIPLSFYFFKSSILSRLPSGLSSKIQSQVGPKPGNCLILEEKYCSSGKIINWDYQGQTDKLIGFRLPPGVPIFSPENGYLASGKESEPFAGKLATVHNLQDPASTVFHFSGDFNMVPRDGDTKEKDIIARTQDTGVKMFGDYNLILMVSKRNPNGSGFITDDEVLKELSRR